jgi:enoyl reductase
MYMTRMYMRRAIALGALLPSCLFAGAYAAAPAQAGTAQCESASAGDPQDISTAICLSAEVGYSGSGGLPVTVDWTPPTCWLEPRYQPPGLQSYLTALNGSSLSSVGSEGAEYYAELFNHYNGLVPPFELGGTGWWWGVACSATDLNASTDAEPIFAATGLSVEVPWEWVPAGPPGNAPAVASPELLAEYAASQMSLPPVPTPGVSPNGKQTVGLATWVWGTIHKGRQLSITATLADVGWSSTVTATPVSVTVSPGGESNPSTLTCPVETSRTGSTYGTAYSAGASTNCSFKYAHPTAPNSPDDLVVSVDWSINWVGHTGDGWPVNLTTTSGATPLTVQEVEAVVGDNCAASSTC